MLISSIVFKILQSVEHVLELLMSNLRSENCLAIQIVFNHANIIHERTYFTAPSALPCSRVPVTFPSSCSLRNQWFLPNSFTLVTVLFWGSPVTPESLRKKILRLIFAADHCTVFDCSSADFVNTHSLVLAHRAVISTSDRLFIWVLSALASI